MRKNHLKILIVDKSPAWRTWLRVGIQYHSKKSVIHKAVETAELGFESVLENTSTPYDIIIMELNLENNPQYLYSGEWLIKQIQNINEYKQATIFIVSFASDLKDIAQKYNVNYLQKTKFKNINIYKNFLQ